MKPTRNTNSTDDALAHVYQAAWATQSTHLADWVGRNWQKMFPTQAPKSDTAILVEIAKGNFDALAALMADARASVLARQEADAACFIASEGFHDAVLNAFNVAVAEAAAKSKPIT